MLLLLLKQPLVQGLLQQGGRRRGLRPSLRGLGLWTACSGASVRALKPCVLLLLLHLQVVLVLLQSLLQGCRCCSLLLRRVAWITLLLGLLLPRLYPWRSLAPWGYLHASLLTHVTLLLLESGVISHLLLLELELLSPQ